MDESTEPASLRPKRVQLSAAMAQVGDMRPGSLVARFRKYGKLTCHCAKKVDEGQAFLLADPSGVRQDGHPRDPRRPGRRAHAPATARISSLPGTGSAVDRRLRTDLRFTAATAGGIDRRQRLKRASFDGHLAAEILWNIEALFDGRPWKGWTWKRWESAVRRQARSPAARAGATAECPPL
jgi:hypothetical protein